MLAIKVPDSRRSLTSTQSTARRASDARWRRPRLCDGMHTSVVVRKVGLDWGHQQRQRAFCSSQLALRLESLLRLFHIARTACSELLHCASCCPTGSVKQLSRAAGFVSRFWRLSLDSQFAVTITRYIGVTIRNFCWTGVSSPLDHLSACCATGSVDRRECDT